MTEMPVSPIARNAANAAYIVADDVRDFVSGAVRNAVPTLDEVQRRALSDLRRDGFAVVPDYWERDRALQLGKRLEAYLEDGEDRDFDGGAKLRFWDGKSYDSGVRRIYHVDRLLPELVAVRNDPWVLAIAHAYYRVPFHSGALVFQHNVRSNHDTRYYHVDGFAREFKAFVYLDDVTEGNGPFTYLRGTHRMHLVRLQKQVTGNREGSPTSFSPEELGRVLNREVKIDGPAGTLILTDVRGLHRGSPQRDASRSVLVNYVVKHPGDLADIVG